MDRQLAFHFDAGACTGCKACQVACKDKNDLPVGVDWRRVVEHAGGTWRSEGGLMVPEGVFAYHVSLSCMHCGNPACVPACAAGAISKGAGGVVRVDATRCRGCRLCLRACPYAAPQFGLQGKTMSKCDFCADLLAQGGNPVCVDACPTRALHWGGLAQLRAAHGACQAMEPLPDPGPACPSFILTPHRHAQPLGQGSASAARLPDAPG